MPLVETQGEYYPSRDDQVVLNYEKRRCATLTSLSRIGLHPVSSLPKSTLSTPP